MKSMAKVLVVLLGAILMGCAATPVQHVVKSEEKSLVADGYARFDDKLKVGQRWLSAQQIAKLNAYRALADQLYDEMVNAEETIGSRVISNEAYRVYLDTYLREARTSNHRTIRDTLKVSMTLKLTSKFYACMGGDQQQIRRCIREDGKLDLTRLGDKPAQTITVNLACATRDCSDQFHVQGYRHQPNVVDDALLNVGLYDSQWIINTGARAMFNQFLIDSFLSAL